ncbi:hypothetical protein DSO57_1003983 [Entomophthora muscae]|uniref:Uncharacterized protein n=1 Tax=Entomophthora muscae TaxID=34485 RepID=A0ACC2TVS1_9FUNG|nr:hypothetical protein DSO57_1003983 [Entomophthora muscae]
MLEIPPTPPLPTVPTSQDFSKLGFFYITVLGLANQALSHTEILRLLCTWPSRPSPPPLWESSWTLVWAMTAIDLLAYNFRIEYTPGKANVVPDAIIQHEDLKDNIPLDQDHNNQLVLSSSQFLSRIIEISAFASLDQEIMEAQMSPGYQSELNKMM